MRKTLLLLLLLGCAFFSKAQNGIDFIPEAKDDLSVPMVGVTGGPGGSGNGVVGAIGGVVDVGGLGAATYTIPLELPEGVGGVQPSLSVTYNSQSGNGLLGWGWTLGGLSAISRVGKNLFLDGVMKGVDFDGDRFALDGQRLVGIGGTYGGDKAEYRTEVDGMSKIVSFAEDSIAHGPAKFRVWTSNGLVMEYGYTPDSKIAYKCSDDTTKYEVALWLLNKVQDRDGNYMEYEYNKGGAHYCVKKISYTGNDVTRFYPRYVITFDYFSGSRWDLETTFIGNHALHQSRLLKSVNINWRVYNPWGLEETARYDFDYRTLDTVNGYYYHRLASVSYSSDGVSYNPTLIQWGSNDYNTIPSQCVEDVSYTFPSNSYQFGPKLIKFAGDFNGDGLTDFIMLKHSSTNYKYQAAVMLNAGIVSGSPTFQFHQELLFDGGIRQLLIADLNGDGRDELVAVYRGAVTGSKDRVRIRPYLNSYNDSDGEWYLVEAIHNWNDDEYYCNRAKSSTLMAGDFLGRGKTELVMQIPQGNYANSKFFYITYSGNSTFDISYTYGTVLPGDDFTAADFNGDGITEVLCTYRDDGSHQTRQGKIYRIASQYSATRFDTGDGILSQWHDIFLGDFNGDGKKDILSFINEGNGQYAWNVNLFREDKLFWSQYDFTDQLPVNWNTCTTSNSILDNPDSHPNVSRIEVGDFNGDGKDDLALFTGSLMYVLYGPVHRIAGHPTKARFAGEQVINLTDIGFRPTSYISLCAGNFLGRENLSFIGELKMFSFPSFTNRYNVAYVTDGMGNKTEFEYDYLTTFNNSFYTWSKYFDEREYDIYSVPFSMKALKRVSSSNPTAGTPVASTKYYYKDAYVHRKGKGVLGFRQTAAVSYINGHRFDSVVTRCSTNPLKAHRALAITHKIVYNALDRLTVKEQYGNGFIERYSNPKVYIPLVTIKWVNSYNPDNSNQELLSMAITENEYQIDHPADDNGSIGYYNHTLKLTDTYEGVSDWWKAHALECPYVTHTETFYHPDTQLANWIINRPDSTMVTSWKNGDSFISKSLITYSYRDNTTYHPRKIKSYPGGDSNNANGLATSTTYEYDVAGNVTRETLADMSGTLSSRTTDYTYQDNRFRASETNALGYVTQSHYDPKYGEILYDADCNGLTTYYNRSDHLGSSEWVRYPDTTYGCTAKRWVRNRIGVYDPDAPQKDAAYNTWKRISGEAPVKVFFDAAGRELRTVTYGLHGDTIYQDTEYNSLGLVFRKSLPYFKGDTRLWTSYYYDGLLRLQATYYPDGTYTSVAYNGLETTTTFHATDQTTRTSSVTDNYLGQRKKSVDAFGNEVNYFYYPSGKLRYTLVGNNSNTRIDLEYDDAGNRIRIVDPNYGEVVETYDAFGQLRSTRTPKHDLTVYEYDVLGRCISRLEIDEAHQTHVGTVWAYSETTGRKGLLECVAYGSDQRITYEYDMTHLNRLTSKTEKLFGINYTTLYTYDDAAGFPLRVHSVTYPTGYTTGNVYDPASGQRYRIEDGLGNMLWETTAKNALGQVTRFETGNGTVSTRMYDPATGRLEYIYSEAGQNILQDLGYVYDDFGNLAERNDNSKNLSETFTYDNLDRLTDISLNNVATGHMVYDALGRMTSKQADGQGVFSSAQYDYVGPDGHLRPHAVSGAVMAATPFPTDSLGLDYTMFDKVLEVGWSSNRRMRFDYGYDHQRIRVVTDRNMPPIHKTYIGNCERIDALSKSPAYRTYLSGPLGVFAVVSQTGGEVDSVTYVLKDHLGSWTVFADGDGGLVREESFDAWGNRRNPATWTGYTVPELVEGPMFERGFTGHEHMEYTGLINMNGRLYDPVMSTFLSVDSYVQEPDFSQNFNRYAYCLNNPLKYTDPDGELVTELVVAMAISAAVNVVMSGINNTVYDRPFFEGAGKAAAIGALQGAFSYGIGAAAGLIGSAVKGVTNATWGMVAQAGFQVAAHGTLGGVSTWARGGSFWSGFASGAVASFVSTSTGIMTAELPKAWQVSCMVAAGGLSGGVTSSMAGGDFWDGVCNGLICAGLNHAMHLAADVRVSKHLANKYVEAARAFLVDMGYDEEQVNQDVTVQKHSFFGKYFAKMDKAAFETTYKDSFEGGKLDSYSKEFSAYESKTTISFAPKRILWTVRTASFTLKYYPDRANSIGIIRAGFSHYVEAGREVLDGGVRLFTGRDNRVYDMHGRNSSDYLNYRRYYRPLIH